LSQSCRFGNPLAVKERAVFAAQVFEGRFLIVENDAGVIARDSQRLQPYGGVLIPAEHVLPFAQLHVAILDARPLADLAGWLADESGVSPANAYPKPCTVRRNFGSCAASPIADRISLTS
jgi:hypothetical protein